MRAEQAVVAALAGTRLFAPVVAVLGEADPRPAGPAGDKSADMALALLTRPDGRRALPLFTAVEALGRWRADARPVPVDAARAALSGVQERCEALVLDPAGPVTFVVRRPALWALARQEAWTPSPFDPEVAEGLRAGLGDLTALRGVRCEAGEGAELRLVLGVAPGLDRAALAELTAEVGRRVAVLEVATRVDSLELRVLPA
ncbi:SseB family protein [Kineococcus terrestris]|uniref:SseB family protein n=1 Tax=Kineococcus terrestris TaxID=2044856 RepID=UPI0034DADB79